MQTYLVGGAVRDRLLGVPVNDRDWVVLGADRQAMLDAGFTPVDADFPVFLHPETGEEYALARRETKSGAGYRGFDVDDSADVTLEEDLRRRDLTINAMAEAEDGTLIDPYRGREDLSGRLLRHVSPAFVDDPLRVLRVARFAAQLGEFDFRVAHDTHRLMCDMSEGDDLAALTAERLWQEMSRAMATTRPWRFFEVLHACGALQVLLPDLAAAMGDGIAANHQSPDSAPIAALRWVSARQRAVAPRLAAVFLACLSDAEQFDSWRAGWRADRSTTRLLQKALTVRSLCTRGAQGDDEALVELALAWQGLSSLNGQDAVIDVCAAQYPGSGNGFSVRVRRAIEGCQAIHADTLRARGLKGAALGQALAEARRQSALAAVAAIE